MNSTTLTIAIAASLLILYLRPVHALAVYLIVLMWYPVYLVITLGTIDISASRIIVTVLLLKCLANRNLTNKFKWCFLDTWVVFYMLVCVIIPCISSLTHTFVQSLENRNGFLMDTLYVYIVARLCLANRPAMITLIKWVALASIPLALLGIIETTTGWQPFAALRFLCPWGGVPTIFQLRLKFFHRAFGPFDQPIMFGSFFAILLPLVFYLRNVPDYPRILAYLISGAVIAAGLSSMSSGPWLTLGLAIFCMVMERFKNWTKLILFGFVTCCLFIEFASNRHFYHVLITYVNPAGGSGWHRAKLIDCAIQHFNEWWLVGYRGLDSGWITSQTDVTNMFILNAVRYGILGFIGFCGILVCGVRSVVRLHNFSNDPGLRSWAWVLGVVLLLVIFASIGSNIRGQVQFLFYVILGMVGSSSTLRPKVVKIPNKKLVSYSLSEIIPS